MATYLKCVTSVSASGWNATKLWQAIISAYEAQRCRDPTSPNEASRDSGIRFQFDEHELNGRQFLKVLSKRNIDGDRMMCIVILEVLEEDRSVAGNWTVEQSVAYRYLKGLDKDAPRRESFGILARDQLCLLFRVVGEEPPETLMGGPKELINILDGGASLGIERIMKMIMESAKSCSCKTDSDKFDIETSFEPVGGNPPRNDSPTTSNFSGVEIKVVGPSSDKAESSNAKDAGARIDGLTD